MDTLASYDELPYDSLPLPETQPDVLAALAKLHGFDAPDPCRARILELGCAQGGNLIPLAWRWPESDCVGVELSRVQAQAGADFVQRLGLANVRILHADLAALPAGLGTFDYILAHGVFSWVPPTVQGALLDVCRRHLSPKGLAYVSFNVAAGWRRLQPLRAALVERTAAELPAPERYRQALAVLDDLQAEWRDPLLLKEIAYLRTAAPSYLFHEYLADTHTPLSFAEFAAALDAHGLRYVGEAGPRRARVALEDAWGLIPESMAGRWQDAEIALDDAFATRFRRAMIALDDAPCAQPPHPDAMADLAFHADLACHEEIDLDDGVEQHFVSPAGNHFPVVSPALKAALMLLSMRYPAALDYASLADATRTLLVEHGPADFDPARFDEPAFREALFDLAMLHGVIPTVWPGRFADEPGELPRAHDLARAQARAAGWIVSGARHVAVDLDFAGRLLLGALDGSRSLDELAAWMQAQLAENGLTLPLEQIEELTRQQLWLYARQGLLV
ncbi:MAG: methyltransferase domain-containing protein [Thiobacillus sp.]